MGEQLSKTEDTSSHLRCVQCNKVLAKRFSDGHFEIKCPRCDTINVVSEKVVEKKL